MNKRVFEKSIAAMEAGDLHVDAQNKDRFTLAVVFVLNPSLCKDEHFCLWDRYWALGPSVALFWKSIPHICSFFFDMSCTYSDSIPAFWLRNTAALWEDLALPQRAAHVFPWVQEEVFQRTRHSLRFAWIAAAVA